MILTRDGIQQAIASGDIIIDPFVPDRLGPNSYDFSLGTRCKTYKHLELDSRSHNLTESCEIDERGIVITPNRLFLFNTAERIGSARYVPVIRGRSSVARLGLFIHITADLIDLGSINQLTLQLHSVSPIRIYPGMAIGQVTFWTVKGEIELYKGKYSGRTSPCESLSYLDTFHDH